MKGAHSKDEKKRGKSIVASAGSDADPLSLRPLRRSVYETEGSMTLIETHTPSLPVLLRREGVCF